MSFRKKAIARKKRMSKNAKIFTIRDPAIDWSEIEKWSEHEKKEIRQNPEDIDRIPTLKGETLTVWEIRPLTVKEQRQVQAEAISDMPEQAMNNFNRQLYATSLSIYFYRGLVAIENYFEPGDRIVFQGDERSPEAREVLEELRSFRDLDLEEDIGTFVKLLSEGSMPGRDLEHLGKSSRRSLARGTASSKSSTASSASATTSSTPTEDAESLPETPSSPTSNGTPATGSPNS